MKTLHLLRHAKSDWSDSSLSDRDRPLSRRGKRERKLVARHVDGWRVDLVVCSTAKRAKATAKPLVNALGCPVRYEDRLYAADSDDLLVITRALPEDAVSVVLVGHNPSLDDFTELLCGSSPHFPTGALATIALAVEAWSDIAPSTGTLTTLLAPAQMIEHQTAPTLHWSATQPEV
jgi:phosphohistidine phosphatase